jgi:electron transfer flavoprotein beta subunit
MGAARAVLVTDDLLAGSCALSTIQVLAAVLRTIEFDLVLAGADSADGGGGVVGAGVATLLDLPLVSGAATISEAGEGAVHVRRIVGTGTETVEAALPAFVVGTQLLGEPRYPTLKGIMGARAKEVAVRSLADLGLAGVAVGGGSATTVVVAQRPPGARPAARVVREGPAAAAREIVDFLVERRSVR